MRLTPRKICCNLIVILATIIVVSWLLPCRPGYTMVPKEKLHFVKDADNKTYPYDRNMPLIFIGGVPRSGTTLMRAILDAHPDVRCGEETRVIPRILGLRNNMAISPKEATRLREAGITSDVLDSAVASFILEIIAKHAEPAPRLCNKDPFTLKSTLYLSTLFPNAKFLLIVRDGRAVVHSIISRRVTITGFDLQDYRKCLVQWNTAVENMFYQCIRVGTSKCLPVYYEQLTLHPQESLRKILTFLDVPWHDAVLRHQEFVGKPGGISLSKTERSTDQVIKPVNIDALSRWVGKIPEDVVSDMRNIAPMLNKLGYDPDANPPKYGIPDKTVEQNTKNMKENSEFWKKREMEIFQHDKLKVFYSAGGKGKSRQSIDFDDHDPQMIIEGFKAQQKQNITGKRRLRDNR
ncbi:protein-tyrosine sulfotransferase 1-like [Lineus longissimus]|uniref:protein-tyrosine sulfotransferase 1-like n=1 Tax=Lineus longissimus TaxID=88925 RepID=UPI00315DADC3